MCSVGVLLSLTSLLQVPAGSPTTPTVAAPPRVLVLTTSAGFEHDVVRRSAPERLSLVERALIDLGEEGHFEAVPTRDLGEFEPARLSRYDAVLFYTTGELPLSPAQRTALLDFVARGKGFVGVHSATDTFYEWPEFGALVGAYFDGHPWHEKVRVRVEDPAHPATRALDAKFDIVDEIYQFRAPYDRSRLHVLLSLDPASVDLARPGVKRTDEDFALAWTREHGKGRVFYTALGHRPEVWSDPRYLSHLRGGIQWALRTDPAPVRLAAEDAAYRDFAREHPGDPARGFQVFRRESGPMCIRCHTVYGAGGAVGPDLSELGRKHTRAQIVEQVLAPSAEIESGYVTTIFGLRDGTIVTGRIQSESPQRIAVWDATAEVREFAPGDVEERRTSSVSLMPEGLVRTLTPAEFADLVAWLGTLKGS
jgi:putative heme-binding domain-containing protein